MGNYSEQFERDGVIVFPELLDPQQLRNGWYEALRRLATGELLRRDRFVSGESNATPGPLGPILESMSNWGELTIIAEELLQSDRIELSLSRLLLKDSTWSGAVELHQDFPYFPEKGPANQVSFFIPLLTVVDGGLIFVKESHKLGPLPRGTIDRGDFRPLEDLAPKFKAGDVIAMHWLTWHYSNQSTSGPRPVMQISYRLVDK